ncbi:YceD family protein [Ancylobacter sp.]|uniref:YceD family protein n=1 Tax=Ancylobacter sp. TaxID=1872567 RepID=UPI003C7A75EC
MTDASPLSKPVLVASLPEDGLTLKLTPDAAARAALAKDFGIPGIPALTAEVTLTPGRGGTVHVTGRVDSVVTQTCVVTLEDFDSKVSEPIDLRFAPPEKLPEIRPGAEIDVSELDLPDPLVDGTIDAGAVAAEFLSLGLDPYPRKPDAEFEVPADPGPAEASPFAALAKLRGGGGGDAD